jgi:hypothetical protein
MPIPRVGLAGLIPVGFQTMSLNNSTAVAVNSTCCNASVLLISVETQHARFRADGTAPTLTTGVLLPTGYLHRFEFNGTSVMKFQRSTGTSKVSLMAYKYAGGDR